MARGTIPRYQQVADHLQHQIAAQIYRPGDRLPSEESLCHAFGVSRITIRAALRLLVDAHLLRRQPGKGTFVTLPPIAHQLIRLTDFVEDMTIAGLHPTSRVLCFQEENAPQFVADQLGVAIHTPVVRLDRLRLANGSPIAFDIIYFPPRFGRLLDPTHIADETIYHQLEQRYGIVIHAGSFLIESANAPKAIAPILEVARGTATLLVHRTARTEPGEVVFYQKRYYRADRVQFRLELARNGNDGCAHLTELSPVFALPPTGR